MVRHKMWRRIGAVALPALALLMMPAMAHAGITTGGAGMPYSAGLATLNTSVQTEVAAFLIVVCVVCGVGGYIIAGQMEGLFNVIGRAMIGIGVIGAVATIATLAGVTGAVI